MFKVLILHKFSMYFANFHFNYTKSPNFFPIYTYRRGPLGVSVISNFAFYDYEIFETKEKWSGKRIIIGKLFYQFMHKTNPIIVFAYDLFISWREHYENKKIKNTKVKSTKRARNYTYKRQYVLINELLCLHHKWTGI